MLFVRAYNTDIIQVTNESEQKVKENLEVQKKKHNSRKKS